MSCWCIQAEGKFIIFAPTLFKPSQAIAKTLPSFIASVQLTTDTLPDTLLYAITKMPVAVS
ncbi:hypothetical protein NDI44_23435 [Trichocoleus sp. DQ-A3]|uniref:hypothetical protein n=1 Tax=Cyanophyceae TaxID=3028117 RepID=UPI001F5526CB|nr:MULTISPECIES: hypothetical protein [unclassified Coleofasciculus]